MPARRRDLERALRGLLAVHLSEVGLRGSPGLDGRRGLAALERRLAAQPPQHRAEIRRTQRRDRRAESGFAEVPARDHHLADPLAVGRAQHRQHPAHGAQRTVEAELAEEQRAPQLVRVELDACPRDRDRDGQVEGGAHFGHAGGCEVHGHAAGREREARLAERGADAIAALVHDAVGLADDVERRQPRARLDLDGNPHAVDHVERGAERAHEHGSPRGTGWIRS